MSNNIRSSTLPLLKYTRTRILQSRHGLYVELRPNGTLQSTEDIKSPFIFLQILTVGTNMVAIWGVDSRLYLAIDEDGTVFTTKAESKECVFKEHVSIEFFNKYQTCHKNEDDLTWYLCMDHEGKIAATPTALERDKDLDFMIKLPTEQAIFYRPFLPNRREHSASQPLKSRSRRTSSLSQEENCSNSMKSPQNYGSVVRRSFTPARTVSNRDSRGSATHSFTDSQSSHSEISYSFTDSMEIAGFTSESSLESFCGI